MTRCVCDAGALDLEAVREVVLPERAPFRQRVAAPDVVDEHVEPAVLLGGDARDERRDLVAGACGRRARRSPRPPAASTSSAVSSIVSGRAIGEGLLARRAARGVDRRAGGAELDRDRRARRRASRRRRARRGRQAAVHAIEISKRSFVYYRKAMARPRTIPDADVLAAAARVVGALGPARLTLAAVGDECGLSPATILQRFGSKRALLLALAAHGRDDVARRLPRRPRARALAARGDRRGALRARRRRRDARASSPTTSRSCSSTSPTPTSIASPATMRARSERELAALVAAAVDAGELAATRPAGDRPRAARHVQRLAA